MEQEIKMIYKDLKTGEKIGSNFTTLKRLEKNRDRLPKKGQRFKFSSFNGDVIHKLVYTNVDKILEIGDLDWDSHNVLCIFGFIEDDESPNNKQPISDASNLVEQLYGIALKAVNSLSVNNTGNKDQQEKDYTEVDIISSISLDDFRKLIIPDEEAEKFMVIDKAIILNEIRNKILGRYDIFYHEDGERKYQLKIDYPVNASTFGYILFEPICNADIPDMEETSGIYLKFPHLGGECSYRYEESLSEFLNIFGKVNGRLYSEISEDPKQYRVSYKEYLIEVISSDYVKKVKDKIKDHPNMELE